MARVFLIFSLFTLTICSAASLEKQRDRRLLLDTLGQILGAAAPLQASLCPHCDHCLCNTVFILPYVTECPEAVYDATFIPKCEAVCRKDYYTQCYLGYGQQGHHSGSGHTARPQYTTSPPPTGNPRQTAQPYYPTYPPMTGYPIHTSYPGITHVPGNTQSPHQTTTRMNVHLHYPQHTTGAGSNQNHASAQTTTNPQGLITPAGTTPLPLSSKQCDKIRTIDFIGRHTFANDSACGTCSDGGFHTPQALVTKSCNAPPPAKWVQHLHVMTHCSTLPTFSPIGTFFSHTSILAGVLISCQNDGFKMAIQTCNALPEVITATTQTKGFNVNDFYSISWI